MSVTCFPFSITLFLLIYPKQIVFIIPGYSVIIFVLL